MAPFPPTKDKLISLGAALKAGRYATADHYVSHYKVQCERDGYHLDPALHRVYLDVIRSCRRGVGGPVKALALPLMRLGELDIDLDDPWVAGGPVGPAAAIIAGAWFLTREVELSTTRARLASLETDVDGHRAVRWFLPASKNDVEARGVSRAHGCSCVPGVARASCPYCAVAAQLQRLERLFPTRWTDGVPDLDLPLFPTSSGDVVNKEAMSETIVEAARRLKVPTSAPDSSARVSGHSLRVTGAQGLARAGVEVWAIQLLGRWGSDTVLEYVREVPLELSTSWAAKVARQHALDAVLRDRSLVVEGRLSASSASSSAALPQPGLGSVARAALTDALAEAADAALVEAVPVSRCRFVTSDSGKWHRLAPAGLAGTSASWMSACGWRFGGSLASLATDLPASPCHKFLCARCFTSLRGQLKSG